MFSGVSMHMGHFNAHMGHFSYSDSVFASFAPDNWRAFLQSGVALWMSSIERLMPCCDLKVVGGDGTSVGIPIGNVAGLKPVWQPANLVGLPETTLGHRHGREFIVLTHDSFDGRYLVRLRTSLRLCLSASVKDQEFTVCVDQYFSDTKQALPNWFTPAFELFLKSEGEFRASLRILLRNLISETSVSTLVPLVLRASKTSNFSIRFFPFGRNFRAQLSRKLFSLWVHWDISRDSIVHSTRRKTRSECAQHCCSGDRSTW